MVRQLSTLHEVLSCAVQTSAASVRTCKDLICLIMADLQSRHDHCLAHVDERQAPVTDCRAFPSGDHWRCPSHLKPWSRLTAEAVCGAPGDTLKLAYVLVYHACLGWCILLLKSRRTLKTPTLRKLGIEDCHQPIPMRIARCAAYLKDKNHHNHPRWRCCVALICFCTQINYHQVVARALTMAYTHHDAVCNMS